MGWRNIRVVLQRPSQKLPRIKSGVAPTPNPSRLREGNVLGWPFPGLSEFAQARWVRQVP
ncbi:hypothetical protein Sj15T_14050 [Sphingobium sp. TA15]|nr:hypothetical protein Sj15T_14050 [Sphingobium sp. TA15]